jgi:hypothetical protein
MPIQNTGSVFVVKERLEALEARIETALDEAGLKDFTKHVAREALTDLVEDIVNELSEKKNDVIKQVAVERLEVDSRLKETQSTFDVAIAEHLARVEDSIRKFETLKDSIDRFETLVKLSLVASILAVAFSLVM